MNETRLLRCFCDALGLPHEQIIDTLSYNAVKEWDSVAHMSLVAALEGEFDVMLDTDEIISMSTVATARDILRKRGVEFP